MIARSLSRAWWMALMALGMSACGDSSDSATLEPVGSLQAAIYSLQDPTTVTAGSPSPRTASCPHRELPDQCGSWAGVELSASRSYLPPRGDEDEHCLCQPIEFQIPASIPVTRGNAGIGTAKLQYRKSNGGVVNCIYKGDARFSGGRWVGGNEYDLLVCSSQAKAGDTATSDWFSLDVQLGDPLQGPTDVQLRLGEADVVGGVVQEQVIYASDSRIEGAALYVPRGSAPPHQDFSLSVVSKPAPGTSVPNGGAPFTTLGYTVDVHASGVDDFHFTPVPGAQCPRIELPYSPQRLEQLMGPGAEGRLRARQITDLAAAASGATALAQTGPVAVDPVRNTITFCVEHLSYYVTGANANDGDLTGAYLAATATPLRVCAGPTGAQGNCNSGEVCVDDDNDATLETVGHCYYNVLTTPPSPLTPLASYRLRLEFFNQGLVWTSANLKLVSVEPGQFTPPAGPSPLQRSPWFPSSTSGFSQAYVGAAVNTNGTAAFDVDVTAPRQQGEYGVYPYGSVLDLCLQRGTAFLSHCFSFDPGSALTNTGATPGPLREVCDTFDNDGDGLVDEGLLNACGGCTTLSQTLGADCNNGRVDFCYRTGHLQCSGIDALVCDAPSTGVENACGGCSFLTGTLGEACNNNRPDNCYRDGQIACNGINALACNAATTGGENVCGGCQTLSGPAPGTDCNNNRPNGCFRGGHYQCAGGGNSTYCDAPDVPPSAEICNGADDDCNGAVDDFPTVEKFFTEQFDWPISAYTKVFYPDYGHVYSSCTMRRTSGGGFGLLHPSDEGNCIADFRNGGLIGTEGGIFSVSLIQQPICGEVLHDVKLRMEGIDDDAYVWIGDAGANGDAVCTAQIHANSGLEECNLTGVAKRYGFDASAFTLKLGNGGGLMTAGQFTLVIDGVEHPLDRQFPVHAHSGWTHRQKFSVNFETGEYSAEPSDACVDVFDCD